MFNLRVKLKYIVYWVLTPFYYFLGLLLKKKTIAQKELLILKLDAIGDYVLFRNFIEVLKTDIQYKDYKITFCGNIVCKSLAETLDSEFVEKFIWIDRKKFAFNLKYRYLKLKEIASKGYEIIIQPTYSRDYYYEDLIVSLVSAGKKIGIESNLSNMTSWGRRKGNRYYTGLIQTSKDVIFEFNRNKEFFEKLLNREIELTCTTINPKIVRSSLDLPPKYLILFIGASKDFRKWPILHFAELGKYLLSNYSGNIVICGGPGDMSDSHILERELKDSRVINMVGKTRLVDLIPIISKSDLMISNETSAPHIAVALGVSVFVLSNGNNFGRFTPYPLEVTKNYIPIFHPEINQNHFQEMVERYADGSNLKISEIKVEDVISNLGF
jgi:ADP-heptose:LPS heptosyltransferase